MELTIENQFLRVEVTSFGAELTSLYHKGTQREYIWGGDSNIWSRQSPILFPNCGSVKNGTFLMGGKPYKGVQHGFAKDLMHHIVCADDRVVTFRLENSKETADFYPWPFSLRTTYKLDKNSLICQYNVVNCHTDPIYFSLGFHTGLRCPFAVGTAASDYAVVFEHGEKLTYLAQNEEGRLLHKAYEMDLPDGRIPITKGIFSKSLVLMGVESSYIQLEETLSGDYIRVRGTNTPYTVLWSVPDNVAAVCIEPWYGIGDFADSSGNIEEKAGIICLPAGQEFTCSQVLEVGTHSH